MITKQSLDKRIKIAKLDFMELVPKLKDESIDLILTDIPFNISKENNFKTMKDRKGRVGIDFGEWDKDFNEQSLSILQSKLKKGGSLVTFHSFEQFHILQTVFNELIFKDRFIWQKTNPMPRNRDRRYISNIEIGSWFVKEGAKWTFNRQNDNYDGCVFQHPSESGGGFKRYHPNQKNYEMIKNLILRHSNENEIVADFFFGSCQVGLACQELNRKFIGTEADYNYFRIGAERLGLVLNEGDV
jgi:site-specific DNA-methyltransferase (adenine-specific)